MNPELNAFLNVLIKIVEIVVIPFIWYVVRKLDSLNTHISTLTVEITKLQTAITGIEGQGGLIHRVSLLEKEQ